jgi:hypothetical protein
VHHAACGAGGLHKVDGDGKGGDSTPKGGVGGRVVLCPQGTVRGARARESTPHFGHDPDRIKPMGTTCSLREHNRSPHRLASG